MLGTKAEFVCDPTVKILVIGESNGGQVTNLGGGSSESGQVFVLVIIGQSDDFGETFLNVCHFRFLFYGWIYFLPYK